MMSCCLTRVCSLGTGLWGALALCGCIDPSIVGQETGDSSSGAPVTDDEGPQTDGATSQGGSTQGMATESGETDGGETDSLCPPILVADCVECECQDGDWSCTTDACNYDCTGLACGDSCMMCPDDDPMCSGIDFGGVCTADGQCVGIQPPKLGFCVGDIEPGFEVGLTNTYGCADLVVMASNGDDSEAVILSVSEGLVADAIASGMPVHVELDVSDPSILMLEARTGAEVTSNECNDAPIPGVDINETWLATSGTVIIDVTATGGELADATVELVNVAFARTIPGPAPILVPSLLMPDVAVGWLPG